MIIETSVYFETEQGYLEDVLAEFDVYDDDTATRLYSLTLNDLVLNADQIRLWLGPKEVQRIEEEIR